MASKEVIMCDSCGVVIGDAPKEHIIEWKQAKEDPQHHTRKDLCLDCVVQVMNDLCKAGNGYKYSYEISGYGQ